MSESEKNFTNNSLFPKKELFVDNRYLNMKLESSDKTSRILDLWKEVLSRCNKENYKEIIYVDLESCLDFTKEVYKDGYQKRKHFNHSRWTETAKFLSDAKLVNQSKEGNRFKETRTSLFTTIIIDGELSEEDFTKISISKSTVGLKINPDLIDYFFNVPENQSKELKSPGFTALGYYSSKGLETKGSKLLYDWLKRWEAHGTFKMYMRDFYFKFDWLLKENSPKYKTNQLQKILEKWIKDINTHTDIKVSFILDFSNTNKFITWSILEQKDYRIKEFTSDPERLEELKITKRNESQNPRESKSNLTEFPWSCYTADSIKRIANVFIVYTERWKLTDSEVNLILIALHQMDKVKLFTEINYEMSLNDKKYQTTNNVLKKFKELGVKGLKYRKF